VCSCICAIYSFFIWVFFCLQHLDTNRFRDWGVSLSYCLEYIVCYTLQLEHRKSVIIHTHCTYITQPFCIQNQSMCFRIAALETQQIITIIPVWFHCRALGFVIFWGYKCIWLEISNAPKHMLFQGTRKIVKTRIICKFTNIKWWLVRKKHITIYLVKKLFQSFDCSLRSMSASSEPEENETWFQYNAAFESLIVCFCSCNLRCIVILEFIYSCIRTKHVQ